jgi:AraC-like DNA-binding protein
MLIDQSPLFQSGPATTESLEEKSLDIQNDQGFTMKLNEIIFKDIRLVWGNYTVARREQLIVKQNSAAVVSHFRFSGLSVTAGDSGWRIAEKEYGIFYQEAKEYKHYLATMNGREGTFFEVEMSAPFFERLYTDESPFITSFSEKVAAGREAWAGGNRKIAPQMRTLIQDMLTTGYSGHLKRMYLEAKITELFLMQVQDYDRPQGPPRLRAADIERLHAAKAYIEAHYDTACSIIDLARQAGINQMKLKSGFKALYGTTVFGYLSDLRMQKARQLLLDEKMYVNEVADRIGYKHPHHFTAAFKKKFGILPSELRD